MSDTYIRNCGTSKGSWEGCLVPVYYEFLSFLVSQDLFPKTQGSSVSVWVSAGMLELCQPCSNAANSSSLDPVHSNQWWQDFQVQDPHSLLRLQTLQSR